VAFSWHCVNRGTVYVCCIYIYFFMAACLRFIFVMPFASDFPHPVMYFIPPGW
jgi:hypothetical protein